jgi:hypothetical protein
VGDVDVAADDPVATFGQHLLEPWRQARHHVELDLLAGLAAGP